MEAKLKVKVDDMRLFTEPQLSRISYLVTNKFRSSLVFPIRT